MSELKVHRISKNDAVLQKYMSIHYSQPKGFVGRQLFYKLIYDNTTYGCIAFGSATKFLPGREILISLNFGMNNIFYHVEKQFNKYPFRNFTTRCLVSAERIASYDWYNTYGDPVFWVETLVELPRTGELYKKANYQLVGKTKGYTCKRISGESTDNWSGKRVWDTKNLRPKLVFVKRTHWGNCLLEM